MMHYLLRRLLLLPVTLFFIILVNFVIINLAPGDPTTVSDTSSEAGAARSEKSQLYQGDLRYLQFREFYGLTLPILFNTWPWLKLEAVLHELALSLDKGMSIKDLDALRIKIGDQARFIMPKLLKIMESSDYPLNIRIQAVRFFVRGGTKQAIVNPYPSDEEKAFNVKIAKDNLLLLQQLINPKDSSETIAGKIQNLKNWYLENKLEYELTPNLSQKIKIFFFETRFFKYMSRVLTLNFGTMRNDSTKLVIDEVLKRFKYSLTLSIIPLLFTFVLCQVFGFWMAYHQSQFSDLILNLGFLFLYAVPIFVVAPFLIEKIALNQTFPFTSIPIPISGFSSPEIEFSKMTTWERLIDILQHLALPFIAVMYGGLAAQTRLTRTAVLEVMRQDYVRTAKAKGLSQRQIMVDHVWRNSAITIVTSVASSLGVVLAGSLIVEALFNINGFGKFFYDAVINRDYNVIMFSAIAGSFLTLLGYLIADLLYMWLDPRVSLE